MKCDKCIHHKACLHLIDTSHEELVSCEHFQGVCYTCERWVPIGSYGGNSIEDLQPLGRCSVFVTGVLATWFCGCYKERKQEGMPFDS